MRQIVPQCVPFAAIAAVAAVVAIGSGAASAPVSAQTSAPVAQQFEKLHFRSIGPAIMSGRIADVAVYEKNPSIWYAGAAHGGVWRTTSNGATFTPIFENHGLMSIGDVTVSQSDPDLLWVGTGESNNRQSTSWGDGVWKTTDGGKTFQHMGLDNSKHINRILIDPANNDVVLVAATGPLFGPGGDRGIYKTTDGGRTWKRVLFVDDDTGANDLAMSATDPKTIYASMYQRRRSACCVNGGGTGSGIWKSTDGGDTWTRLTNGLPAGALGRIGLEAYRKNGNIVYASIEAPAVVRPPAPPSQAADSFPPASGRGGGRGGTAAGATPPGESGLYRSDDGGQSWHRVSTVNPRPLYFSQVRVDPNNPDRVAMGGVKMQLTIDGGKTMETNATLVAHDDVHAIWIDPANSDHMIIGDDGGLYTSYDGAKTWNFFQNVPVGLFYHVSYDMSTPYTICGGMQDNYDWCGPSQSRQSNGILNHEWYQVQGGDGFEAVQDLRDPRIVYTESQDGNMIRRNKVTGESKTIRPNPSASNVSPAPAKGETYRWEWDTPMMLSPHDPGTLIVGANKLFVSHDRGDSWTVISPDLTTGVNRDTVVTMGVRGKDITISRDDGVSQWPALVTIAESPKQAGLYYTGSDDGVLSMSRDGGKSWQNLTSRLPGAPAGGWVSRVVPSRYDAGTVYVTIDNHRLNDFDPHMWVSTDFGATFQSIVNNLTGQNVRTFTEDTRNRDVLYIGTETGIFLSLDRGRSWQRLKANFPDVRVDEITLHPRDNAMLVATHGRALWVLDHLEPIQEYTAAQNAATSATLFNVPTALEWKTKDDRNDEFWGHNYFVGENPPNEAVIGYFVKQPGDMKVRISDPAGKLVRELAVPAGKTGAGIQTICWDLHSEPIVASADSAAAEPAGRGGRGGAAAAGGGRGGRGGPQAVPGVPAPVPTPHDPVNPCAVEGAAGAGAAGGGRGAGGFGGVGGGGLGGPGPYVAPGNYTVALVSGGKTVGTKTMKVVLDPEVKFAPGEIARYTTIVSDLNELQRKGTADAVALNALYAQMADVGRKVTEHSGLPASAKAQFDALTKALDAVRKKFGVPTPAPGAGAAGGRGGGRGGPPPDPENMLARTAAAKTAIGSIWEMPSGSLTRQSTELKLEMPKAIAEANAVLARAAAVSQTLKKYDITLTVPPVPKTTP